MTNVIGFGLNRGGQKKKKKKEIISL